MVIIEPNVCCLAMHMGYTPFSLLSRLRRPSSYPRGVGGELGCLIVLVFPG